MSNEFFPLGVWKSGDGPLPTVGTLCAIDLMGSEYRVARLAVDEDVAEEEENNELAGYHWTDAHTGETWELDDVGAFAVLQEPE